MFSDLLSLGWDAKELECDICIVGGGVAGITLARRFLNTPLSAMLVESGGKDYDQDIQRLYAGQNVGAPYYELDQARLRFFGGTIHIWGGRNCPLDPVDFRSRNWIPGSGWPISPDELTRYYQTAHNELELGPYQYDARCWSEIRNRPPNLDADRLKFGFWRFDMRAGRYGVDRCQDLHDAQNINVLCHASLTHIQAGADARRIDYVVLKSLHGHRVTLRARHFVLACGGIENPRLLLAANNVEAAGIGNSHDQVGRCFMEHPHARAARITARDPHQLYRLFQRQPGANGSWLAPSLQASESLQRDCGILNTAVTVKLLRVTGRTSPLTKRIYQGAKHVMEPDRFGRGLWRGFRNVRQFLRHPGWRRLRWWHARWDDRELYLFIRGEQAPNPASRVLLSSERDALGMPRTNLDWRMTALDKRSAAVLVDTVAAEFMRLGLGMITPEPWLNDGSPDWPTEPAASNHPFGGYHHMGTTRMSTDPRSGVVDRDCRVHGYDNLYLAGSSVFPTSGWANPTLTIIALAHRLGEHLRSRLR